jgi:hypothetical protein
MPAQRSAFCVFCDDIRAEVGNKQSLMGIYSGGEMAFPEGIPAGAPVLLPKFAIMMWFFSDKDDKPERLTVRVFIPPGRTEIIKFEIPRDLLAQPTLLFDDVEKIVLTAGLPIIGLALPCEGTLEVTVETERETIRAGRLRIRIPGRPDPTLIAPGQTTPSSPIETQPPSGQSPPAAPEIAPEPLQRRRRLRRSARTPEPE